MDSSNGQFEKWRNEQIASLVRMGYPDAAKAFRDLGSVQWAGWQAAWQASRESLVVELPKTPNNGMGFSLFDNVKEMCKDAIELQGVRTK